MTRGIAVARALLEQRQERAREMEDRLDVGREDLVPRAVRILAERCAPVRAGVVDEDMERRLLLRDLLGELAGAGFGADVGRCRDARAALRELGRDPIADVLLARRDVDFGARLDEAARDHQADAPRAAGHEGGLSCDREQVFHGEVLSCALVLMRSWRRWSRQRPVAVRRGVLFAIAAPGEERCSDRPAERS